MKAEQMVIPENWREVSLLEVVQSEKQKIVGGPFGSNLKVSDYQEEGVPIVRLQNVEISKFKNTDIKFISKDKAKELAYHNFKKGDIILAKLGNPIGKTCIVPDYLDHGILTADVVRIRVDGEEIDRDFLLYVLNSYYVNKQLKIGTIGSTRPRVNLEDVRNLKVLIPPLREQQAISSVLSNVDKIIHSTQQLIDYLQLLRKGLMQQLFTQGIEHTEFKETKIGRIPKGWQLVKLEELLEVRSGKRLPKGEKFSDVQTSFPYIRVLDFKDGTINPNNLEYLTPQHKKILNKYTISSEDVYISIAGSIGIVGLVPDELNNANLTENAASLFIKEKKKLTKEFLYYYLDSNIGQKEIRLRTTITTLPKLAFKRIEKIPIILPSIYEQNQITSCFIGIDQIREEEINNLTELKKIRNGLMQDLLTGKKRVSLRT